MDYHELSTIRLKNQQLTFNKFQTTKQLVEWMGALQAQDYNNAKWAIGIRLPHLTEEQIEASFNEGEFLRTHLMRPTWHFVNAEDIYWMLELTGPQIKSTLNSRHRDLGLTEQNVKESQKVIQKALNSSEHFTMTRDELIKELDHAGIPTDLQRSYHFILRAEIDGIICSGALKGKKQTYALLEKRVPNKKTLPKSEALEKLARRYFLSHGPATLADFIWWSGLPASDARKALESIQTDLISTTIEKDVYWLFNDDFKTVKQKNSCFLLPAFDEFLISYKNRSASITLENHKKAISNNGIFRPIVIINGQISGLWKKKAKKDNIIIETDYFRPHNKSELQLITEATGALGFYSGKKAGIQIG